MTIPSPPRASGARLWVRAGAAVLLTAANLPLVILTIVQLQPRSGPHDAAAAAEFRDLSLVGGYLSFCVALLSALAIRFARLGKWCVAPPLLMGAALLTRAFVFPPY